MERLAVIADIHGNRWALEAVLADIRSQAIDAIVNLGDSLDEVMDPAGTAALLMQHDVPTIAGSHESYRDDQLSEPQRDWLARLPDTMQLGDVYCCHGTPRSANEALLEDVRAGCVTLADDGVILSRLAGVRQRVVLCAHKHVPRVVALSTGQVVVNPGSVGLPAYEHDDPVPHAMEAGSPHARYAVLEGDPLGTSVRIVALRYRWDLAAARARRAGREDRAGWIERGRATPHSARAAI